jgi:hypothetical protein
VAADNTDPPVADLSAIRSAGLKMRLTAPEASKTYTFSGAINMFQQLLKAAAGLKDA